jgi:aminomethyltransferase
MKNTVFTEKHKPLGAKMIPFAGFYMPVQYEGLAVEHFPAFFKGDAIM